MNRKTITPKRDSRIFGSRSIFPRIFAGLIALFLVLILIMTFWMNRMYGLNQRRETMRVRIDRLAAADRTLSMVISYVADDISQLHWAHDVMDYTLRPEKADQSDYYLVTRMLKNTSGGNPVIKKTVYYSEYSHRILNSENDKIETLEGCPEGFLFEGNHTERNGFIMIKNNTGRSTISYLSIRDGRIFIVQDLVMGVYLASISCELDVGSPCRLISDQNAESWNTIYPFGKNKEQLFLQVQSYQPVPGDPSLLTSAELITEDTMASADPARVRYYLYSSESLPFTYLMPVNPEEWNISLRDMLNAFLPVLIALFAVSIIITVYVVRSLYQPINRLLELTVDRAGTPGKTSIEDRNEIDRLEAIYAEAMNDQRKMSSVMEAVSSEIFENLLRKLVTGYPYTEEQLTETLQSLGNPVPATGRFMIAVCQVYSPESRNVSDSERTLYIPSLSNLIRDYPSAKAKIFPVACDADRLCVLMSFPEDMSAVAVKKEYIELSAYLKKNIELLPYQIYSETGQIINTLTEAGNSYREAVEIIEYHKGNKTQETAENAGAVPEREPQHADTSSAAAEEKTEGNLELDMFWARRMVDEIVSLITEGENAAAKLKIDEILRKLENFRTETKELRYGYLQLWNVFMERIVSYPLTEEEQEPFDEEIFRKEISEIDDRDSMTVYMEEKCLLFTKVIREYQKKAKYRYVDAAKGYISEHYSDSDLSLSVVAEKIGISSSYLSEQFNEVGGEKFSSYLAEYRIDIAKQLLMSTELTIKEIGERCGFNSPQNFNRVFRKITGITPAGYRNSKKS